MQKLLSFTFLLACGMAYGQTDSLTLSSASGAGGSSVTLNVSLSSSGTAPAAVEWTAAYPAMDVASVKASVGAAGAGASKSLSCYGGSASYTCVASGMNAGKIANGVLASLTFNLTPGATTFSVALTGVSGVDATGTALTMSSTGGSITVSGAITTGGTGSSAGTSSGSAGTGSNGGSSSTVQISSIACSPQSVTGGQTSTCTVSLSGAAPTGGDTIQFHTANPAVSLPASVTIAAGAKSANVTASTTSVASMADVLVTASDAGASVSTAIVVQPGSLSLSGVSCTPATLTGGSKSNCTVTLSGAAPTGGATVSLTSNSASLTVPVSVGIAAGSQSATFVVSTLPVSALSAPSISASYGGATVSGSVTIQPPVLSSVACSPSSLTGGASSTCTVTISGAAPTGGSKVTISSGNAAAQTPSSITVPAGATTATATVTTSAVASAASAVITASLGGVSQADTLSLTASGLLSSVQCTLPTVSGTQIMAAPGSAACSVTLSSAASSAETITLSGNSPQLSVPKSVSVPAGASSAKFTVTAGTLPGLTIQHVTIAASANGATQTVMFTMAVVVSTVTCTPTGIMNPASTSTTCTVKLSQNVPATAAVAVSSSSANLTVPAWANVPTGSSSVAFTATIANPPYTVVTVSAALSGIPQTATVTVGPAPVKSVTCTPTTLTAGKSSTCTLTLVGAAPTGGEPIALSSSSGKLSVPSSATVAAGATSVKFAVTALTGFAGSGQVTAIVGGASVSATISDGNLQSSGSGSNARPTSQTGSAATISADARPSSALRLACSPRSIKPGEIVTCGIHFDVPAGGSGAELSLSSSHPSIRVPARVEGRRNQTSLSFQAEVDASSPSQTVSIAAALGSSIAEDRIVVQRDVNPVLTTPGRQRALLGSKLSFQVTATATSGVAPLLRASGLPRGASFDPATGRFEWTPGAAQSGRWNVAFTATDESGRSAGAEVSIQAGSGTPEIDSVQNAASGSADSVCSSGSLAAIRGEWLSNGPGSQAPGGALDLGGTRVLANGQDVPVVYASPTEVVFVCPSAPAGAELGISVETDNGVSASAKATVLAAAPGIFTVDGTGRGHATATIFNGSRLAMPRNYRFPSQPAQAGDSLSIHMTGLPANIDARSLLVRIGDVPVPADFVRTLAGAAGVFEVGVTIPVSAGLGESIPISVQVLGGASAEVSQTVPVAIEE